MDRAKVKTKVPYVRNGEMETHLDYEYVSTVLKGLPPTAFLHHLPYDK